MKSRRDVLKAAASTTCLAALATGIPARVLLSPRSARAQSYAPAATLLMFTSRHGDPINANVPGMYEPGLEGIVHPPDPAMAATELTLSGRTYRAARPWAQLPQSTLDRSVFFHHATYTPLHQDHPMVMRLSGGARDGEMYLSILSEYMAPRLDTLQSVPISLGATDPSELLSANSETLANVPPLSLKSVLAAPESPLANLAELRDQTVDKMYDVFKRNGSPEQLALLDGWTRAREEARRIGDSLLNLLDEIQGNDEDDQVVAAAALAAMNVSPAITMHGSFGGDNHRDDNLQKETAEHISGIARIQNLVARLDTLNANGTLRNEFLVSVFNVFGRSLRPKGNGRDHNRNHNVAIMIGNGMRGSVVGGVVAGERDYQAASIDADTGEPGGIIFLDATLGALGKTLGMAVGVEEPKLDHFVRQGVPVFSTMRSLR